MTTQEITTKKRKLSLSNEKNEEDNMINHELESQKTELKLVEEEELKIAESEYKTASQPNAIIDVDAKVNLQKSRSLPTLPSNVPKNGFYYHYKHDKSSKDIYNYAYEVVGCGLATDPVTNENSYKVIYRPLYESAVYIAGKLFDVRQLDGLNGFMTKLDNGSDRFVLMMDPNTIEEMKKKSVEMYPLN